VTATLAAPEETVPARRRIRLDMTVNVRRSPVSRAELMLLSRQLGSFIQSGIPIVTALEILVESTTSAGLRQVLGDISRAIQLGVPFTDAVSAHPKVFPPFYRGMLASAELTGRLDEVLEQLAVYIERDIEAKRKTRSALTYPTMVLFMSFGTVAILALWVLPKFKKFFATLHAKLPLSTRLMLSSTDFLRHSWWAVAAPLAAGAGGYVLAMRSERGRYLRDATLLRLPVIGRLANLSIVERFCRSLASMVGAGVSLPTALAVSSDSTNNRVYQKVLGRALGSMLQGDGLAGPIAQSKLFPPAAVQMIRVGESSGQLEGQLSSAARFYGQELDYRLKKFTTLFEPAVIIFMGVVVGFVAVALVQAMYGIYHQVKIK